MGKSESEKVTVEHVQWAGVPLSNEMKKLASLFQRVNEGTVLMATCNKRALHDVQRNFIAGMTSSIPMVL